MNQQALAVIEASVNGRDSWHPLKPSEVPDWVKNPDTMARMISGEQCMKCDDGPTGSLWYRAIVLEPGTLH